MGISKLDMGVESRRLWEHLWLCCNTVVPLWLPLGQGHDGGAVKTVRALYLLRLARCAYRYDESAAPEQAQTVDGISFYFSYFQIGKGR